MRRAIGSFLSFVALATMSACTPKVSCEDAMLAAPAGPPDPVWARRGVVLPAAATVCGSTSTQLHAIEKTQASPEQRTVELRDALSKSAWRVLSEGYEPEGDYVVRMDRGGELLFFNVHRVAQLGGPIRPFSTLAFHVATGPLRAAP